MTPAFLTEDQHVEDEEESLAEESSTQQPISGEELFESDESTSQSLKQRAVYPRLTRDIEARIVQFVQEHEFLYIKTHELYCNRDKKQAAWEELAAELKMDTKRLKTFWKGLRTRFGKLTKKKSGDPAPTFSERDQCI